MALWILAILIFIFHVFSAFAAGTICECGKLPDGQEKLKVLGCVNPRHSLALGNGCVTANLKLSILHKPNFILFRTVCTTVAWMDCQNHVYGTRSNGDCTKLMWSPRSKGFTIPKASRIRGNLLGRGYVCEVAGLQSNGMFHHGQSAKYCKLYWVILHLHFPDLYSFCIFKWVKWFGPDALIIFEKLVWMQ